MNLAFNSFSKNHLSPRKIITVLKTTRKSHFLKINKMKVMNRERLFNSQRLNNFKIHVLEKKLHSEKNRTKKKMHIIQKKNQGSAKNKLLRALGYQESNQRKVIKSFLEKEVNRTHKRQLIRNFIRLSLVKKES